MDRAVDEESIALEDPNQRDKDDEIVDPFGISKKGIENLMNAYLSRKLDEDIVFLKKKGGMQWLEKALCTDYAKGIKDDDEFLRRIEAFDSNKKPEEYPVSFCAFVFEALQDRMVQILIVAAIVSIIVNMVQGHNLKIDWIEGFAIIVTVNVVIFVGAITNYNKEIEFQEIKKKQAKNKTVNVRRLGQEVEIAEDDLLVGDIMMVQSGMSLPADGILIDAIGIAVDESPMTGEADLVEKDTYEECLKGRRKVLDSEPNLRTKVPENSHHKIKSPILSSGTQVTSGKGWMVVIAVGANSQNGIIMSLIEANKSNSEGTPLQQKLVHMADFIGYCGLGAAILTAVGMTINLIVRASQGNANGIGIEIMNIFLISILIIIVAIPEGLPLAVALTLSYSMKRMIQDQNYVRRMEACETMGGANFICTDKTGTLTKNEMTIVRIYDGNKVIGTEEKNLVKKDGKFDYKETFSPDFYEMFKLNSACNSSTVFTSDGKETANFKTDLAFTKILKLFGEDVQKLRRDMILKRDNKDVIIPFNSKRKKMSTFIQSKEFPQGYRMLIKGGSDVLLPACQFYQSNGKTIEIDEAKRIDFQQHIKAFAEGTLRTVIIAFKEISETDLETWNQKEIRAEGKEVKEIHPIEESGFTLTAIVGIMDVLKEGVDEAVKDCQTAQINVIMVTGDNIETAVAIAKSCNIYNPDKGRSKAVLGEDFLQRIGGVVCKNCFNTENYLKALADAKKNFRKPLYYGEALKTCEYKCSCFRSEDEAKSKIKQKIISSRLQEWREAQKNPEAKDALDEEIEKKVEEEMETTKPPIKTEVIANIGKFESLSKKLCVIARSQPYHKYCLVAGLRQIENVVAVTGDGTNDAAALSKADVGFAMNSGTDIAKDASDIIITDDNFTSIVGAVLWGRSVYDNIRRFLQFQLSVNVVACTLVFIGSSIGAESPLSAIQMLWVNLIMDSLGSLALATENPHRGLLNRAPSKKTDFMVSRKMSKHVIGQSIYQLVILFILLFDGQEFIVETNPDYIKYGFGLKYCFDAPVKIVPPVDRNMTNPEQFLRTNAPDVYLISGFVSRFGESKNVTDMANKTYCNNLFNGYTNMKEAYSIFKSNMYATSHYTIIFNTFVIMQLFNEICCRIINDDYNLFARLFTNYLFLSILGVEFGCQAIIVQFTKMVFKVSEGGLTGFHWGVCFGFSAITFFVNFLLKLIPDAPFSPAGIEEKPASDSKVFSLKKGNTSQIKNPSLSGNKRGSISAHKQQSIKKEGSKSIQPQNIPPQERKDHVALNSQEKV